MRGVRLGSPPNHPAASAAEGSPPNYPAARAAVDAQLVSSPTALLQALPRLVADPARSRTLFPSALCARAAAGAVCSRAIAQVTPELPPTSRVVRLGFVCLVLVCFRVRGPEQEPLGPIGWRATADQSRVNRAARIRSGPHERGSPPPAERPAADRPYWGGRGAGGGGASSLDRHPPLMLRAVPWRCRRAQDAPARDLEGGPPARTSHFDTTFNERRQVSAEPLVEARTAAAAAADSHDDASGTKCFQDAGERRWGRVVAAGRGRRDRVDPLSPSPLPHRPPGPPAGHPRPSLRFLGA